MLLSIPSPGWSAFHLGPLTIHAYALCILTGIVVAWRIASRRFVERGGSAEVFEQVVGVAVVAGIVGARLYHVLTDHQLYFGPGRRPVEALYIWNGGLGIWGAVAGGALAAWVMCRRHGASFTALADSAGPALLVAQAIGRVGNWFNQELFGRPTSLPWGLEIDAAHRPPGYASLTTFHPTFLYELLWNLAMAGLLLLVERRWRLAGGRTFALYIVLYCLGRTWIEHLRIDTVNHVGGLRLNEYTSVAVLAVGVLLFVVLGRRRRPSTGTPVS